ncbi:MAG: hypothetical protein V9H69_04065 [Anaerolineae bacterium]
MAVYTVGDHQVQIAVAIHVGPGQREGCIALGRGPGAGRVAAQHAAVVDVEAIGPVGVAHSQVQVAVAVHIAPGRAGGGRCVLRQPVQRQQGGGRIGLQAGREAELGAGDGRGLGQGSRQQGQQADGQGQGPDDDDQALGPAHGVRAWLIFLLMIH